MFSIKNQFILTRKFKVVNEEPERSRKYVTRMDRVCCWSHAQMPYHSEGAGFRDEVLNEVCDPNLKLRKALGRSEEQNAGLIVLIARKARDRS